MNKSDIITVVASKAGVSRAVTGKVLDEFFEVVMESVSEGGNVCVTNFGVFSQLDKKETNGLNPKTRERMVIPASTIPKFKAGKEFKERVKKKAS